MYKIFTLPIIDVSAKITESYFIYKLGLTMVSLLGHSTENYIIESTNYRKIKFVIF